MLFSDTFPSANIPPDKDRTRVKICGLTRRDDAVAAVRLGADALGLVFYAASPRAVGITQAQEVIRDLPSRVSVVALFVNATESEIRAVLGKVRIDLLQFHGDETPQDCMGYGVPYIKAVRMREDIDLFEIEKVYASASGLLLDSYQRGVAGGTGVAFDWARVPQSVTRRLTKPIILAGGLTPDNVAEAIRQVRPYAVDVSGGVESMKGMKDAAKMAAFMQGVNNAKND
jgi:phosphoribosylanthranilate isomerase